MAEGNRLLSGCTGNCTPGSNPGLSAINLNKVNGLWPRIDNRKSRFDHGGYRFGQLSIFDSQKVLKYF